MNPLNRLDIHSKDILKKSSLSTIIKVLGMICGFILSIFLGRQLGPEGLGIINLANRVTFFALTLGLFGIPSVIVKEVAINYGAKNWKTINSTMKSSILIGIFSSLLISTLLIIFSHSLSFHFFRIEDLTIPLIITVISLAPQILTKIYTSGLAGLQRIWQSNLIDQTISSILTLIIVLLITFFKKIDIIDVTISYFLARVLNASISKIIWSKQSIRKKEKATHTSFNLLKKGAPLLLVSSSAIITANIDVIIIGSICDVSQVGLYSLASKIALLSSLVLRVINSSMGPKIALLHSQGKKSEIQKIISKTSLLFATIGILPIPIAFFFGENILKIWGNEFADAWSVLLILFIGQFFNLIKAPSGIILIMCNQEAILGRVKFTEAIFNIILTYILTLKFGYFGAALGTTISFALSTIVVSYIVKRKFDINTTVFNRKI